MTDRCRVWAGGTRPWGAFWEYGWCQCGWQGPLRMKQETAWSRAQADLSGHWAP